MLFEESEFGLTAHQYIAAVAAINNSLMMMGSDRYKVWGMVIIPTHECYSWSSNRVTPDSQWQWNTGSTSSLVSPSFNWAQIRGKLKQHSHWKKSWSLFWLNWTQLKKLVAEIVSSALVSRCHGSRLIVTWFVTWLKSVSMSAPRTSDCLQSNEAGKWWLLDLIPPIAFIFLV